VLLLALMTHEPYFASLESMQKGDIEYLRTCREWKDESTYYASCADIDDLERKKDQSNIYIANAKSSIVAGSKAISDRKSSVEQLGEAKYQYDAAKKRAEDGRTMKGKKGGLAPGVQYTTPL
jgi:hypothetical protein